MLKDVLLPRGGGDLHGLVGWLRGRCWEEEVDQVSTEYIEYGQTVLLLKHSWLSLSTTHQTSKNNEVKQVL